MSKMSRRIVVDASVAGSAGGTEDLESGGCRRFLLGMLRICHRVVWSAELQAEWRQHASGFSVRWLAAMQSKGKIVNVDAGPQHFFEQSLATFSEAERHAVRKDALLVKAAVAADRLVASRDEKARALFWRLAQEAPEIRSLVWVNPCKKDDDALAWLEGGARSEAWRRLGGQAAPARQRL